MKYQKLLFLMSISLFCVGNTLQAQNINNTNTSINIIKYKKSNELVENINNLINNIQSEILKTGNFNFNPVLTDNVEIENNYPFMKIKLFSIDNIEWQYLKKSIELPVGTKFETNYTLEIPYKNLLQQYHYAIEAIKKLKNTEINLNTPINTNVVWYKPTGNGNFEIYINSNGTWENIGTYFLSNGKTIINYIFNSPEKLSNISFLPNTSVYVKQGNAVVKYTYTYNGLKTEQTSKDKYYGITTLKDLLTVNYNKEGGSTAFIAGDGQYLPYINGYYKFIKNDNYSSGGFWESVSGKYWVYDNIENLYNNVLSELIKDRDIVFTMDKNFNIYKMIKIGNIFAYYANNLPGVLLYKDAPVINGNVYVYDTKDNFLFLLKNGYFAPINNAEVAPNHYYLTWKGRMAFPAVDPVGNTNIYLTQIDDCTKDTCFGSASNGYFAGLKTQTLYTFYPANISHSLNHLADAQPFNNWQNLYDSNAPVAIYTGNNYNDVKNMNIYMLHTYNGNRIYSEVSTGRYLNRNQGYYIPQNYLAPGYNGVNVNIGKLGYNQYYINLFNDKDIFKFSNAKEGYFVKGNAIGIVEKCNNYSDINAYWSDNCNNIGNARIAIGMGSRSELPGPNNAIRINLTKNLGNEPRHTPNGIKWNRNNNFYQWFYDNNNNEYVTNNMTDVYCPNGYNLDLSNFTCKKFLGWKTLKNVAENEAPGHGYNVRLQFSKPVKLDWVAFSEDTRLDVRKYDARTGKTIRIAYWGGQKWDYNVMCDVNKYDCDCSGDITLYCYLPCTREIKTFNRISIQDQNPILEGSLLGYHDDGCVGHSSVDYFGEKDLSMNTGDVFTLSVHEGGHAGSQQLGYVIYLKPIPGVNYGNSSPISSFTINGNSENIPKVYDTKCPVNWKWNNTGTACIPN